jgi:hypothetical protein
MRQDISILASANLSLGGVSILISKVVPHLSTIAVLVQIAVGLVSLWHMLKPRKNQDEKSVPIHVIEPKPADGVQSNTQKS